MPVRPEEAGPRDLFGPGSVNCGGCGMGLSLKLALEVLGPRTILTIPACCAAVSVGAFPVSAVGVSVLLHAFETTGATIAGVRAALDVLGVAGVEVVGWAGDGGTYDIGLQALSGAAERNDDVLYVCYDNEAYMNTGVQRSSATPPGAWTSTTPLGKPLEQPKKDLLAIVAAHHVPYAASLSAAFPEDFRAKFRAARAVRGFRFLLVHSPCPPGWRADAKDTVRLGRLAVTSGVFPLVEVRHGRRWRITVEPTFSGLDEYLDLQGRFAHLTNEQRARIRAGIELQWEELRARVEARPRAEERSGAGQATPSVRPQVPSSP